MSPQHDLAEGGAEDDVEAEAEDRTEPEPEQPAARRGRRRRRAAAAPRRPAVTGLLIGVAAVVLATVAWSVQPVRTVLLQSFTQQNASFTELYFTTNPSFEGATAVVPLALNAHGTGVNAYELKVTLLAADGKTVSENVLPIAPKDGTPVPLVARLPAAKDVAMVRVALVGHPQTLHFRFGKAEDPKPVGKP
ncbi:hypothetical protein F4556_002563 [Kitasatospora gansuensis]|uniref:Uncharacterized protein n=1 Tax=Kitasatospora gansuensis TaxID=258050 RepID=A0A7W7SAT1_9ACTN|nr:hypothetical protein [Kitasatospora gansuensis]MBB4947028.1 hypothetical protein [Kitasatospora gansuensis]